MIDYLQIYEQVLTEASKQQLRQQFKNVDEDVFNKIFEADPYDGKYAQWLLKIYEMGGLPLEDLYKATEYLTIYHKVKNKLDPKYKNIHQSIKKQVQYVDSFDGKTKYKYEKIPVFKSLQDLFKIIKPYKEEGADLSKNEKLRKENLVYENDKWEVYIPHTYEASCQLGSGTEWCTATGKTRKHYNDYSKDGQLFIIINKNKREKKYQFHFKRNQFMDKNDDPIDIEVFFTKNPDILFKFFAKKENNLADHLIDLVYKVSFEHPKYIESFKKTNLNLFKQFLRKFIYSYSLDQNYAHRGTIYSEMTQYFKEKLPIFFHDQYFLEDGIYNARDYGMFNILVNNFNKDWLIHTKLLAEKYDKINTKASAFVFHKKNNIFFLVGPNSTIITENHTHCILILGNDGKTTFKAIHIDEKNKKITSIDDFQNNEKFIKLLPYIKMKKVTA